MSARDRRRIGSSKASAGRRAEEKAVRRAIQHGQESPRALSKRDGRATISGMSVGRLGVDERQHAA
jgi:hypothetical protein